MRRLPRQVGALAVALLVAALSCWIASAWTTGHTSSAWGETALAFGLFGGFTLFFAVMAATIP